MHRIQSSLLTVILYAIAPCSLSDIASHRFASCLFCFSHTGLLLVPSAYNLDLASGPLHCLFPLPRTLPPPPAPDTYTAPSLTSSEVLCHRGPPRPLHLKQFSSPHPAVPTLLCFSQNMDRWLKGLQMLCCLLSFSCGMSTALLVCVSSTWPRAWHTVGPK